MTIGGLQKFSMLDYPGHLAAIIFTQGCNFRCHFCYNPLLVWPQPDVTNSSAPQGETGGAEQTDQRINLADLFVFLRGRQGKLEGVVITGGEPTIHADLPDFIREIRALGYKIKLDTNGTNPEMIERLTRDRLVDYLAMDVKSSPARYAETVGAAVDLEKIKKCAKMIMASNLPYEFRTTAVPGLVEIEDIEEIGQMISGAEKWFIQQFRSNTDLVDHALEGAAAHRQEYLLELKRIGQQYAKNCELR